MSKEDNRVAEQLIEIFENVMRIEQIFIARESKQKLSMTEIHTIAAIGIDDLCNMSRIACKLHITMGTLTVGINNLVKKGFVERYKSEKDRRMVKVGLTKKGKEIYHIHERFHQKLVSCMTKGLSEEQKGTVATAIWNLEGFVEEGYREMDIVE